MGLYNCRVADLLNKGISHVRDGCGAVQPSLFFHLKDQVLAGLLLVLIEPQRVDHSLISLDHLRRRKSHRNVNCGAVVLDQVHDRVNTAVHGSAVVFRSAEILPSGFLLIAGHMDGVVDQLVNALVGGRRDRDDRDAHHLFHLVDSDTAPVAAHLVHHVDRQDHGNADLHQLHGQIQVPLDVGGVHDVDDALGAFL